MSQQTNANVKQGKPDQIKNRSEIVFLYDVRDANPNGDPDNNNLPRIDEFTGQTLVTDVRLKRFIRDYWVSQNKPVLIRAEDDAEGHRKSMDVLAREFLESKGIKIKEESEDEDSEDEDDAETKKKTTQKKTAKQQTGDLRTSLRTLIPEHFIDVRNFGAAITMKKSNTSLTGTVQFGLGRSLNKPTIKSLTITTSLAAGQDKGQGTIGEYHILDYALIRFHGVINEITGRELNYSESDKAALFEAMWNGIKNQNTRSKFNHVPRLLMVINSKPGKTQIGDMDLGIKLKENTDPKRFEDCVLDINLLLQRLKEYKDYVESIEIKEDPDVIYEYRDPSDNSTKTAKSLKEIIPKIIDKNMKVVEILSGV